MAQDDLQPHPVKDQLSGITYCLTSPPPWPETILLGFQHYLVMLGTTVLIPTLLVSKIDARNEDKVKLIQTLLFVSGLNTLLQSFFGTRLPAVIGPSYSYVPTTVSIIMADRYTDILDPQERFEKIMCGIQGALIVSSLLQFLVGFSGLWRNVARFLSPLSAVPLVAFSGFGLYEQGFPLVWRTEEFSTAGNVAALSRRLPLLRCGWARQNSWNSEGNRRGCRRALILILCFGDCDARG